MVKLPIRIFKKRCQSDVNRYVNMLAASGTIFGRKFITRLKMNQSLSSPSTYIGIFLNPQLFLSGFKNFPINT